MTCPHCGAGGPSTAELVLALMGESHAHAMPFHQMGGHDFGSGALAQEAAVASFWTKVREIAREEIATHVGQGQ